MTMRLKAPVGASTVFTALAIAAASTASVAASTWVQLTTPTAPPPRAAHAMEYDGASGKIVLFGGYTVGLGGLVTYLNDTWTFDGTTWTQETPRVAPPPRASAAIAYDAVTQKILLFGGWDGLQRLGDTWVWDGSTSKWTEKRGKSRPGAKSGAMGFRDPTTGHAMIFGGFNGFLYDLDTYMWTGKGWQLVKSTNTPYARSEGIAALDEARNKVVQFGGLGNVNPNNTWLWDGTDWALQSPTVQPPLRYYSAAAFDPGLGDVIMFAGGPGYGDTWAWAGSDWEEVFPTTSPAPREGHAMAYDVALGHPVVFGGENATGQFNDTWEFVGGP